LPEGGARERVCREKGIDTRDDVGLLFAIGEDCAGALSIAVDSLTEKEHVAPRALTEAEIEGLARSKGVLDVDQIERRFSLAGVQEKQPVRYEAGQYLLPNRFYPSTHILKFETYPLVCFAETIANQLAARIGLLVVDAEYLEVGGCPYLRIERYDRVREGSQVLRLHQEDLLQAIGEPTALKYQSDGGPGISRIAEVLRAHSSEPARSILQLRDWQMFNYLVGNWDGHAKNLALLYERGSAAPKLTPFYDLVAIEYLNVSKSSRWSRKLAFYVGENDLPERVSLNDWNRFADDLSIPKRPTLERLAELAEALPDAAAEVRKDFADKHGDKPIYDNFHQYIVKRCEWTKRQPGTP
jgi:serine/threonine-protein kinase HipA